MRDMEKFGELIDAAWKLNVDLDPDHTNPVIEELRERVRPHVSGAKLLGAGRRRVPAYGLQDDEGCSGSEADAGGRAAE